MERDYETKGNVVIDTEHFGTIDASKRNFKLNHQEMTNDKNWQDAIGAKSGLYCLTDNERDIPF